MKQFTLVIAVSLACAGCSVDEAGINPDQQDYIGDQSSIVVHVVVEDLAANNGGCAEGTYVHNVQNAKVSLFSMDGERSISADALLVHYTNKNGDAEFDDLPPGNYQVKVVSDFGNEKQTLKVVEGKVTKIFMRF